MKSRYDDVVLEKQRLQDRVDSMEFVRRNYNSSSRQLLNSSAGGNSYLPPASSRSGRGPSVARYTSVERETDPSLAPPYRSREPSVARRASRDYSSDRWSTRRDSTTNAPYDHEFSSSNARRPDRWSTATAPNMSSSSYNFSSLPGRTDPRMKCGSHDEVFVWSFACLNV